MKKLSRIDAFVALVYEARYVWESVSVDVSRE
jgi:hypothetical protein